MEDQKITSTPAENQQDGASLTPAENKKGGEQGNGNTAPTNDDQKGNQGGDGNDNKVTQDAPKGNEDYRTKFTESSAEGQRLAKILQDNGIDPKTGQPIKPANNSGQDNQGDNQPAIRNRELLPTQQPPTGQQSFSDEELENSIPGFSYLAEEEKNIIRNAKTIATDMASMKNVLAELMDERTYSKEFKQLTTSDETLKTLAEHADEFKEFAYHPDHLNIKLPQLAKMFMVEKGLMGAPAEQKPKEKPAGLEAGGGGKAGGANAKVDGEMTAEEAAMLRRSDPKRYSQLAQTGKLKIKS